MSTFHRMIFSWSGPTITFQPAWRYGKQKAAVDFQESTDSEPDDGNGFNSRLPDMDSPACRTRLQCRQRTDFEPHVHDGILVSNPVFRHSKTALRRMPVAALKSHMKEYGLPTERNKEECLSLMRDYGTWTEILIHSNSKPI
jgi:hypothetical protein